jgi:imidazolonepropionase-like amidohydrolase
MSDDSAMKDVQIEIIGDRINKIAPRKGSHSSEKNIIDWSEYNVMPGLFDCHDHLTFIIGEDEELQAKVSDIYLTIVGVSNIRKMLKAGITTVRAMGDPNFIDMHIKRAVEDEIIIGPRLLIACHPIVRTGGQWWFVGQEVDSVDQARWAVRNQIKNGADFIKIMISGGTATRGSSPTMCDFTEAEINVVVEEAHRLGRKVAAHIHGGPGVEIGIDAGVDSIEHGAYLSEKQIKMMAQKDIFLVSTYGTGKAVMQSPNAPDFQKRKVEQALESRFKALQYAHQENINICVGTDINHADLAVELQILVEAGYRPIEALRAATINGARLCGIENDLGTIEEGKVADLIATKDNPLNDVKNISHIVGVMKKGKVIDFS